MKLTTREKVLLLVLAFLMLNLGAIQMIFTPLQKQETELKQQALLLEDEINEQQIMIDSLDSLNKTHQDLNDQLREIQDQFLQPEFAELKDEYLHETLKDVIKEWNSLAISGIDYAVLPNREEPLSAVLMVQADFTVTGTMEALVEAMDKIQQLPQIISISELTMTRQEKGVQGSFHIQFYTFNFQ